MPYGKCPNANESCKYWNAPPKVPGETNGCFSDIHHHWWPSYDFTTSTEKQFRQLACFKELVCRVVHDEVHFDPPPVKPDLETMRAIIAEEGRVNV